MCESTTDIMESIDPFPAQCPRYILPDSSIELVESRDEQSSHAPHLTSLLEEMAFSKFTELPIELREQIWKAALPTSRVVLLEHKERHFNDDVTEFIPRIDRLGFRSDTRAPSILFASKEAYTVASRYYRRAFTNQTSTSIPEVYFDFANDFLYLGPEWGGPCQPFNQERILYVLDSELHSYDLSRVKNLAIWWDPRHRGGYRMLRTYLQDILEYFDNVSHIALIQKIYRAMSSGNKNFAHNAELKLLDGSISSEVDLKVRGNYLPGTSRQFSEDLVAVDEELQLASLSDPADGLGKWKKVPNIEFNMIVTPEGEAHLLELAKNADSTLPWELEWFGSDGKGTFRRKTETATSERDGDPSPEL